MDDKILYYILIGAIYVLYNWLKRRKQSQENIPGNEGPVDEPARQSQPKPKPLTFEELLREITEAKQPVPEPQTEYERPEQSRYEPLDYDEDIEDEVSKEEVEEKAYDFNKEPAYQQFEAAKQQAFYRKSLEETTRLEDVNVEFGRFKVFDSERQRSLVEIYTEDLRNPEGFKKALILSEILNRKHF